MNCRNVVEVTSQARWPGTVLIVDDDAMIRQLVARVLERRGYQTQVAADGNEASNLFREMADDIGLLLTDMAMPGKSGLELAREVKALRPDLPILLMSGNFGEWSADVHDFPRLQKPFQSDALLRAVEKYFGTADFDASGSAKD